MRHDWTLTKAEELQSMNGPYFPCGACGKSIWSPERHALGCPGPKPATQEPREWQISPTLQAMLDCDKVAWAEIATITGVSDMMRGNTGRHETPTETGLWDRLRADLNNLGAAYGPITEGVGEAVASPEPVEIWLTRTITEEEARERYPDAPNTKTGRELMAEANKVTRAEDLEARVRRTMRWNKLMGRKPLHDHDDPPAVYLSDYEPQLSDSDRNAYFDGIILAARKKREREYGSLIYDPMSDNGHEWSWNTDACEHCGLTSTEIIENGDERGDVKCDGGKARDGSLSLSAAMSRPLDWEPRVGHKGVEIDG